MKLLLIDAKYNGEIKFTKEVLEYLKKKKYKTIVLYTTTQFNHGIPEILEQLKKENIKVVSSQPERTNKEFQILGCDIYHGNLNLNNKDKNIDAFLYIGNGKFHPRALLFEEEDSQDNKNKEVITYDPIGKKMIVYDKKDIEKVIQKRKANIKKFLTSEKIGVVVTVKPGQEHMHYVEKLEKAFPNKKFYVFITDNVSFSDMENFNFIQCWINTACPRIGMEDALETNNSILNAEEALSLKG